MLVGLPSPFVGFRRWKALLNTVAAARFPFLDEALDDTMAAFISYCPNIINGTKVLIYLTLIFFFLLYLQEYVFEKKKKKKQSFGTVCHRNVCLTFLSLGAKISGTIAKFRGCSLKIQHWSSFHLNNLENCPSLQFKNSLKSMHLSHRLMEGIICR